MSCLLRMLGLSLPAGTALLSAALQPPYDGPRGATNVIFYGMLVAAAFVGAILLRSWLAVVVMPVAIVVPGLLYDAIACPDCSSWTYDTGPLGAVLLTSVFLVPVVIAAVAGTVIGQHLEG